MQETVFTEETVNEAGKQFRKTLKKEAKKQPEPVVQSEPQQRIAKFAMPRIISNEEVAAERAKKQTEPEQQPEQKDALILQSKTRKELEDMLVVVCEKEIILKNELKTIGKDRKAIEDELLLRINEDMMPLLKLMMEGEKNEQPKSVPKSV